MAVAFAIIIAIFIIYNTFVMAVGERRKQLGILRAIGATPSQIQRMILRELPWISDGFCGGLPVGYLRCQCLELSDGVSTAGATS